MLFSIILGVLFAAVVFFHYVQGFFSALISAILAVFAAVLAFSWHEWIVESYLQGKAANIAHAMVLVVLFAAIYLILRVLFDKAIPNGITLPVPIDRVGGGLMGLVAATFSVGILAIAAEELPFGSSIMGYTKYETADTEAGILLRNGVQTQNGYNFDDLHSTEAGRFQEPEGKNLFPIVLPGVDEIVVSAVSHLSESGSLQGSQPLSAMHPDFLQELYGQNIGIQAGAQHVTLDLPKPREPSVVVTNIFTTSQVIRADGEMETVRGKTRAVTVAVLKEVAKRNGTVGIKGKDQDVKFPVLVADKDKDSGKDMMLVIVRMTFGPDAADTGESIVRISPGSIRIYGGKTNKSGVVEPVNYYPIGTLEFGTQDPVLFVDKPDDYLLVPRTGVAQCGLDMVFVVDKSAFINAEKKIAPGTFIEVKRMWRMGLGGKSIEDYALPASDLVIGALHQESQPERAGFLKRKGASFSQ